MPWSNQSGGGGWRGGGGGGPWGSPPRGPSGGGGQPPDLEEILRRSQDRLKTILPGGDGFGVKGLGLAAAAALALWLVTGFYRVESDEIGVELVLGQEHARTQPGLNYNWPYPIGQVYTPQVLTVREMTIGMRETDTGRGIQTRDVPEESLMLTGDENLVDVDFKVQWAVKDAGAFLFNIQMPEATVKAVSESAMREAIGRTNISLILTEDRRRIEIAVRELMQKALDDYKSGIEVRLVQMQKVDPPQQVIDAFRDVQAARIDAERLQNEAQAYANRIVPEARGQAAQIINAATAYQRQAVEEARGQADRFSKIYEEYSKAPDITRERLYLETMERVFGGMDKVIIDQNAAGGQGVVPYLPLDRLTQPRQPAGPGAPRTGGQP
ncbi:FtsH protease activity modulator HflK [Prosthecomicrobium sp. N25]|uniref:FtsH protease activity modulator HflK n=1 Tax=Prosthecomicrobium sp. N25 TaxID=3129254 RepID=UPI003077667C